MTEKKRRCALRRDLKREVPAEEETVAAWAKCTLAVPAKWVSEEAGEEGSVILAVVVVVVAVGGVAVVVLAAKAGLVGDLDVEEALL